MTSFVDTNIIIRHLTGDPPAQARRATALLASGEQLLLADLIVAETIDVLESFYEVPRPRVAELIRAILAFPPIVVVDETLLLRAVEVYEVHRLDVAEACLVACAESTGVASVTLFDRALRRVPTVRHVIPGDD
ncbi:MAG: PIN domain-containing protein [Dermatophilaceae bacterium]